MVPKRNGEADIEGLSFRAVLFRMVPKRAMWLAIEKSCFRAVLFRMVPKPSVVALVACSQF